MIHGVRQQIAERIMRVLENIAYGRIEIVMPDGSARQFCGAQGTCSAKITVTDWRAASAVASSGDVGFADAYREGWVEVDNLTDLLVIALHNAHAFDRLIYGSGPAALWMRALQMLRYWLRSNSMRGSRRNIYAHYDIGNEFFKLWLDRGMTYSSALFQSRRDDLYTAQTNKYDRILDRLGTSGSKVLEIGCGWGGFTEHAVKKAGHKMTGITISRAQQEYAEQRLKGAAEVALRDYRHQDGKYDHIVSIEMFEAVGEKYWPHFFSCLKARLARHGNAMMQVITIGESQFARYRRSADFIRSYIFPGGMLPSYSCIRDQAARAGLSIHSHFSFADHYARTLACWRQAFDQNIVQIQALGYDRRFVRIWQLYFSYCLAGFSTGHTDVMQIELRHA